MKFSDFKLGKSFWTATGEWRVTDIGTRTVVAIPLVTKGVYHDSDTGKEETHILSEAKDPDLWSGPPYAIAEEAFSEDDYEGCVATKKEYNKQFVEVVTGLKSNKRK